MLSPRSRRHPSERRGSGNSIDPGNAPQPRNLLSNTVEGPISFPNFDPYGSKFGSLIAINQFSDCIALNRKQESRWLAVQAVHMTSGLLLISAAAAIAIAVTRRVADRK